MSIGATLAAARRRAGMTVGDVSRRTRVTEPIIRGIERDDYAACGGDVDARGHIRAIAHAVGEDPVPLIDEFDSTWRSAHEITAAEAFGPGQPVRTRERRRVRWMTVLAALVMAVLGFAAYKLVAGTGGAQHPAAVARAHPASRGHASPPRASAPAVQASTARSPGPVAVRTLAPAGVAAFGPAGTADGDDPQRAALAIAGDSATPWYSDWYTTSDFGRLQAGTGLLLDMGHAVTVTSVRVSLVSLSGADLELRAGGRPVPSYLSPVAGVPDAGGTVQLSPGAPVHARYLLLWFTKLPPDAAGTYQVGVYEITVRGHLRSRHER